MDDCHCIAVAFSVGIDAVLVYPTLTRVAVVVCIGTGPEVPFDSIAIVPPRLNDAIQFERCAEAIVLVTNDATMDT